MLENLEKEELINIIQKLEKENKELKEKIYGKIERIEIPKEQKVISNEEKVKIFRDIFKGRTDLYAKRWISNKTGKSGYSPVCRMNSVHINVINHELNAMNVLIEC